MPECMFPWQHGNSSKILHCTKYAGIRRRIYQRRVKKQHLRIYYSHLYHTVFPCNHLISTAGLSFLPHITSIPLLFGFRICPTPAQPTSILTRIVFPADQQSILNDQFYVEEMPEEIVIVVKLIYSDRTHST